MKYLHRQCPRDIPRPPHSARSPWSFHWHTGTGDLGSWQGTQERGRFPSLPLNKIFASRVCFKQNFFIIIKCVFSNILRGIALIGQRLYLTCNIFSLFPAGFRVASAIRTGLSSDLIRRSWSYIYLQICSMSSQLVTTPLSMG